MIFCVQEYFRGRKFVAKNIFAGESSRPKNSFTKIWGMEGKGMGGEAGKKATLSRSLNQCFFLFGQKNHFANRLFFDYIFNTLLPLRVLICSQTTLVSGSSFQCPWAEKTSLLEIRFSRPPGEGLKNLGYYCYYCCCYCTPPDEKKSRLKILFSTKIMKNSKTLTWPKIPEDSSDFDDSTCVLIVTTRSIIWDILCFFAKTDVPRNISFREFPGQKFAFWG